MSGYEVPQQPSGEINTRNVSIMSGHGATPLMFDGAKARKVYYYGPTHEVELVTFPGEGVQVTYLPTAAMAS